jgi:DHA2 family multidrug resistance protein
MPFLPRDRRQSLTSTMIATCMLFGVDGAMISLALPSIRNNFAVDNEHLSWVVSSHLIGYMAISPCVRWLCSHFGRREIFCFCLAAMTVATALCALATSIQVLIFLRVFQGAALGVVFPLTLAILLDEYAKGEHPRIITWWTTAGFVGPIVGTASAGVLIDRYEWPSIFVFQAVACLITLIGAIALIRKSDRQRPQPLDVIGLITIVPAIVALQFFLIRGLGKIATFPSLISFGAFGVCGLVFGQNIRRAQHSIVNPALFADRNFAFSVVMIFIMGFEIFSLGFIMPLLLADVIGADAFQISMLALPRMIGTAFGAAIAGKMSGKLRLGELIAGGFGLIAVGSLLMLIVVTSANSFSIIVAGLFHGVGVGVASTALGILTVATLPDEWRNEGTALRQLLRIIGGTVGISILVAIIGISGHASTGGYLHALVATAVLAAAGSAAAMVRLFVTPSSSRAEF